ncbi:uncharacterized protein B0H18DRAFT_870166 [Fomitopsis serialis]|uniref:uncharacterized protein n=1 Tax=Fomitopsis serialis TaxID=139415 RepID=UPI002008E8EA|nr:uncharacterized protein B0H18DRAFT_870166 [Neoantrodia serialis]KAH9934395.1 hypothetical protein B0H18DRAFT_870166 [Neoantrodia serialis]
MLHTDSAALRHELIDTPAVLAAGSLALSAFMSCLLFDTLDWRPILICILSDYIAIGLDHYLELVDIASTRGTVGHTTIVFQVAKALLVISTLLLSAVLFFCPPRTWLVVAVCFGPAFVWDIDVSYYVKAFLPGGKSARGVGCEEDNVKPAAQKVWSVKRIPGLKALLIGVIRVYGTYAIVSSCSNSRALATNAHFVRWVPWQFFLWSVVDRTCHAVMEDVRDYPDDLKSGVPTIPVLLRSIPKSKLVLSVVHVVGLAVYHHNHYIILSAAYAIAFVWLLDHTSSRSLYHLSYHSQTIAFAAYGLHQLYTSHPWLTFPVTQ